MLLDHLFAPLRCPGCEVTSPSLCPSCRAELTLWTPRSCLRCGAVHAAECLCELLPSTVTEVRSRWELGGLVADLVEDAKYAGHTWPIRTLRPELTGWLGALGARADTQAARLLWVPVPATPARLRRTGFDLALTLARWGAKASGGALGADVLGGRPRRTPQARLDRAGRLDTLEGRFFTRRELAGSAVVLVDDVITTGATVTACALALAAAGAGELRVVSLARTPRRYPIGVARRGGV